MDETKNQDVEQIKADVAKKAINARNGIKKFFSDNLGKIAIAAGVAGAAAVGFLAGKVAVYDGLVDCDCDPDGPEALDGDSGDEDDDETEDE